jgi:hypothetical protein
MSKLSVKSTQHILLRMNVSTFDFYYPVYMAQQHHLRTYHEGSTYPTFKDAIIARGLLLTSDDEEWNRTLNEGSLNCYPWKIQELFAIKLLNCPVKDPKCLFVTFFTTMAEDFAYQYLLYQKRRYTHRTQHTFGSS